MVTGPHRIFLGGGSGHPGFRSGGSKPGGASEAGGRAL